MSTKQTWRKWAVALIKKSNRCPGEYPSFGTPDDLMTEEEFQMTIQSSGTHKYVDCHLLEEVIGVPLPDDMRPIAGIPASEPTDADRKKVENLADAQTLAELKQGLRVYVDQVRFKDSGVLYIPEPLLNLAGYVKKFFDA